MNIDDKVSQRTSAQYTETLNQSWYQILKHQAPVVQKVPGSAIHWINLYPKDSAIIGLPHTCPLDSDLSSG